MNEALAPLVLEACRQLGLSDHELKDLVGASLRSVKSNTRRGGSRYLEQCHKLVRALFPKNPQLAEKLALAAGTSLVALGVMEGATREVKPVTPEALDSIVAAAADAANLAPKVIKPALAAALRKAQQLGIGLDALVSLLAPQPPALSPHIQTGDEKTTIEKATIDKATIDGRGPVR